MEMTTVKAPLMEDDQDQIYCNNAFQFDNYNTDDSSSGYDTTDLSDTESSASSVDSCDSLRHDTRRQNGTKSHESYVNLLPAPSSDEEIMNFQSVTSLSEKLELILTLPDLCDVTFLVGPLPVPVHGVRAIMGTRSRVLYQLILKHTAIQQQQTTKKKNKTKTSGKTTSSKTAVGLSRPLSERLIIPVKKYDSEVFRLLIQFVHCGSVNITEDTVAGLYCGAQQFELPDLSHACVDFVERCLSHNRSKQILSSARAYSHLKATNTLFHMIYSMLDKRYTGSSRNTAV